MKTNQKTGRGGQRAGAGRPRNDSQLYTFRAGGKVAQHLNLQPNKTQYILNCIQAQMQPGLSTSQLEPGLSSHSQLQLEPELSTSQLEPELSTLSRIGQLIPATQVESLSMPFFDLKVVAGFPIPLNNDERAQKIDVLRMLCPHPDATYLIRVKGDSMIDSNIFSGDILVIDKSNRNPTEDEVAMCELNGEYTVKFVRKVKGQWCLVPANPKYPNIPIAEGDEFNVWGVVTYVIHQPQPV